MSNPIDEYLDHVYRAARTVPGEQVLAAARALAEAHSRGATVFLLCPPDDGESVGHLANELQWGVAAGSCRFHLERLFGTPGQAAGWRPDWAYEDVYVQQLRGRVSPGDVLLVISRRGRSLGMVRALEAARRSGATTVVMVGFDGGTIKDLADICLHVQSDRLEQVEDVQMMLAHMLSSALRDLIATPHQAETACTSAPGQR
jgi:D-sedoheptulose 7-phosphate isomerase